EGLEDALLEYLLGTGFIVSVVELIVVVGNDPVDELLGGLAELLPNAAGYPTQSAQPLGEDHSRCQAGQRADREKDQAVGGVFFFADSDLTHTRAVAEVYVKG